VKFYEEVDRGKLCYLGLFILGKPVESYIVDKISSFFARSFGGKTRSQNGFQVTSGRKNIVFLWPAQGQRRELIVIVRPNTVLYKKIGNVLLKTLLALIIMALMVAGVVAYLLWTGYFDFALYRDLFHVAVRVAAYTLGAFIAALAATLALSLDLDRKFLQNLDKIKDVVQNTVRSVINEPVEKLDILPEETKKLLTGIKAKHMVTLAQMMRVKLPGL